MRLIEAQPDDVVRNARNHSHYRFAGPEKSRARIRPLELFPNGLLIPKPTDTIVDPAIQVHMVGPWHEGMTVEGTPGRPADRLRPKYEAELASKRQQLVQLQAAYDELPASGVGKQSRGSWANKVKNVKARIHTLEIGLALLPEHESDVVQIEAALVQFSVRQLVQLPSGRPARVQAVDGDNVRICCMFTGECLEAELPSELLRPWAVAHVATV